jgi:hypothetical protein
MPVSPVTDAEARVRSRIDVLETQRARRPYGSANAQHRPPTRCRPFVLAATGVAASGQPSKLPVIVRGRRGIAGFVPQTNGGTSESVASVPVKCLAAGLADKGASPQADSHQAGDSLTRADCRGGEQGHLDDRARLVAQFLSCDVVVQHRSNQRVVHGPMQRIELFRRSVAHVGPHGFDHSTSSAVVTLMPASTMSNAGPAPNSIAARSAGRQKATSSTRKSWKVESRACPSDRLERLSGRGSRPRVRGQAGRRRGTTADVECQVLISRRWSRPRDR